ncbi:JAB domain-containing protein, partial [Sphingobium estronivorans]|uniref:JAB domain-containing protein n=1 Tax=Sphingobium estronivorans TaxID=1577690 RepID=UPI003B84B4B3
HNHPAGTAEPSLTDRNLTERMVAAAHVFAVTVHDHLVICREGYVSFRRAGLL